MLKKQWDYKGDRKVNANNDAFQGILDIFDKKEIMGIYIRQDICWQIVLLFYSKDIIILKNSEFLNDLIKPYEDYNKRLKQIEL